MFMRLDRIFEIKMTEANQKISIKLLWISSYIFTIFLHVIKYRKKNKPLVPAKRGPKVSLILA